MSFTPRIEAALVCGVGFDHAYPVAGVPVRSIVLPGCGVVKTTVRHWNWIPYADWSVGGQCDQVSRGCLRYGQTVTYGK